MCVGRVRDALNTLDALKPGSRPLTFLLLALLLALAALGSSCDQSGVYVATGGLGGDVEAGGRFDVWPHDRGAGRSERERLMTHRVARPRRGASRPGRTP